MLSENQQEVLKNRLNADVNLPLLDEEREGRIIESLIDQVTPVVEPALRSFLPGQYVDCLKIALMEGVPVETKRERINSILQSEIAVPLARELNRKVDAVLVPERLEGKLLEKVADKIVEELVEWTVGEIDSRLRESLVQSREALGLSE